MRWILIVLIAAHITGRAQEVIHIFNLGGTDVVLQLYASQKAGPLYYNMHDNEKTSVEAGRRIVQRHGGELYELVHSGERNITFTIDTMSYAIDPNRIYTDAGVWRELARNGSQDTAVFGMVRAFGDSLVQMLGIAEASLVVALHNNTDGGYSMDSYMPGAVYDRDAAAIYIGRHRDPDNFYFITAKSLFIRLQPSRYHIVLQDNTSMTDDGSLSVFCGIHGIDYINVEAEHGKRGVQRRMLRQMLRRLGA